MLLKTLSWPTRGIGMNCKRRGNCIDGCCLRVESVIGSMSKFSANVVYGSSRQFLLLRVSFDRQYINLLENAASWTFRSVALEFTFLKLLTYIHVQLILLVVLTVLS